ncbi:MAG: hypothetical protein QOD13_3826 [Thermoleophilaceae bacterium]|nr:hypothetical protein [Thermoleophilaceae bacterium]
MMDLVQLAIEERGDVVIARVTGELDLAGAPTSGQPPRSRLPWTARALVVDFSGLEFIDSSGIAMLFNLARRLGSRRQELRVVAPDGKPVARVLDIVEFHRAAPVHQTLEEALAQASPDGAGS